MNQAMKFEKNIPTAVSIRKRRNRVWTAAECRRAEAGGAQRFHPPRLTGFPENKYGEMVVQKIATRYTKKALSHDMRHEGSSESSPQGTFTKKA